MAQFTETRILMACAVLAAFSTVRAEDVEKRFRIGLSVGAYDSRDEVLSDAANVLTLTDVDDVPQTFFIDPRNDDAAAGTLSLNSTIKGTLSAQYAVNQIFVMEFSAGYQEGEVGDIELQVQFDGDPVPDENVLPFQFRIFRIRAGDITQVPLKVTALARFRPAYNLHPYVGMGVGYTLIGFDPSNDLNTLSRNMDNSVGRFAQLQTFPGGFNTVGDELDLGSITVEAEDTFAWHLAAGVEYSLFKKWAAYLDIRYTFASRSFNILFSGMNNIGISVPDVRAFESDPIADADFGAMRVAVGGFVDGGRLIPRDLSEPTIPEFCGTLPQPIDCSAASTCCTFVLDPDGVADPGFYYVQGGNFRYDNVTVEVGIRFTF